MEKISKETFLLFLLRFRLLLIFWNALNLGRLNVSNQSNRNAIRSIQFHSNETLSQRTIY
ncbi:uncharacterized protein [Blastocystis hominis]|uniref:Uncharacterized protein n=1 Tax=Blastocystis hominis TaxID=12968 RepID=D8LYA7_BLAHO|nr:uncharacterized protein [Blastocystis hominis]CBK20562.2 unnamed protein product [Blastocystis hominis]|eukprot:XP_012894610.1 uncharacterized protein [Blastocystis hominis]